MGRFLYLLTLGGLGALLVHILTIFLIPIFAENDAWARLPKPEQDDVFTLLNPEDQLAANMRAFDPNFVFGACRFDLSDGPYSITGGTAPTFWSLSVYNRGGINVFSINDKGLQGNSLDVVIATPLQIMEMQTDAPAELAGSVFVEVESAEGFVLLRSYVREKGLFAQVQTFVGSARCEQL
jgi:uncharacterized membrane protein